MKFHVKCVLLFLIFLLGACAKPNVNPETQVRATGQQFLDALYQGKVEEVRSMLDNTVAPGTDPSDVMNKALFVNQIDRIIAQMQEEVAKKGFERVEIENITFNQKQTQATVFYKAYYKDGSSETDNIFFKSANGTWLMDVLGEKEKPQHSVNF